MQLLTVARVASVLHSFTGGFGNPSAGVIRDSKGFCHAFRL
ncbi:MAG TPA: hypothetical protein VMU80_21430 [Bryobacteraceae bacterium]|nr:hypothetical protein [Bryobacteraceae bacterium]